MSYVTSGTEVSVRCMASWRVFILRGAMSEVKLQKIIQVIERLKLEEELPRVKVSQASQSCVFLLLPDIHSFFAG